MRAIRPIVLIVALSSSVRAGDLFFSDFESGLLPGSTAGTGGGDLSFRDVWTLSRSFETGSDGQHVRYDFAIPSEPAEPDTYWYGGLTSLLGEFVTLPPVWRLSFRIATSSSQTEDFRLSFSMTQTPAQGRGTRGEAKRLFTWITIPGGEGWQEVVIDSSDVDLSEFTSSTFESDLITKITIAMSSLGSAGDVQSLAEVGNHFMLIDNLKFEIPLTPFVSLHSRPDGGISLFYSGTLQSCDDLAGWTAPSPQPPHHSVITPSSGLFFYRASTE